MAQRAPATSPKTKMEPGTVKRSSRAEQLTATFRKAAKRAVAEHAAAGRSVYGKVGGRLTEVRPTKNK